MQMTNGKRKKFVDLIFFGIVIVIYHVLMSEYRGDAINTFSKYLENASLSETLVQRYTLWTSRVFIETPLILLSHNMHIYLWKICDIVMWIVLANSLMRISHHKNDRMLLGLILMYPIIEMSSAGWIPTTINYLWPLTAACVSLISLDKLYFQKKIYILEALIYLLFELFATNFETLGVMYSCILIWFAVHFYSDRKPKVGEIIFWLLQMIISIGNVLFALTCPGNMVRKQSEIYTWMKDFPQWTVIDKLVMGINTTVHEMVDDNLLFLVFSVVLFVGCLYYKKNNKKMIVIGCIPMIFVFTRTLLKPLIENYFPIYNEVFDSINKIDSANYFKTSLYFSFIIYIIIVSIIILIFLNVPENIKEGIKYAVLWVAGMLTRIIMGFSPTLNISGNRIFIYLDFVMIFLTVSFWMEYKEKIKRRPKIYMALRYGFMCLAGIALIGNLISINS